MRNTYIDLLHSSTTQLLATISLILNIALLNTKSTSTKPPLMARRRDTASEPPRSHRHHSSRQQPPPQRQRPIQQKECGFDWTPGIVLALLGALTLFNYDFDRYKKKHDGREREDWDDERGRRRYRSRSRRGSEDDYYDYGRGRKFSR
ncbi:hypothetical protein B0J15DRAFT_500597 [Fusarium solani]|uniref:Uncharacterized protein n=1 Tax=Fusarium solani TaxID=169388 RepID=A0A9P9GU32_FUSSL|nr:uncharacterized protein B0J15DRAFT_500597 [Fusarium solani]KAH7244703.1 hypothetical protein B0J15DRAFT_500597 [Fusarium solani]